MLLFELQFVSSAENGSFKWCRKIIRQVTLPKKDIVTCFIHGYFEISLVRSFYRHLWTSAYLYLVLLSSEICTVQDNIAHFLNILISRSKTNWNSVLPMDNTFFHIYISMPWPTITVIFYIRLIFLLFHWHKRLTQNLSLNWFSEKIKITTMIVITLLITAIIIMAIDHIV